MQNGSTRGNFMRKAKTQAELRLTEQGDHFLPHKFIKRTFEHQANTTKQLLNAGRGLQAPRKAAHCLQKEMIYHH